MRREGAVTNCRIPDEPGMENQLLAIASYLPQIWERDHWRENIQYFPKYPFKVTVMQIVGKPIKVNETCLCLCVSAFGKHAGISFHTLFDLLKYNCQCFLLLMRISVLTPALWYSLLCFLPICCVARFQMSVFSRLSPSLLNAPTCTLSLLIVKALWGKSIRGIPFVVVSSGGAAEFMVHWIMPEQNE